MRWRTRGPPHRDRGHRSSSPGRRFRGDRHLIGVSHRFRWPRAPSHAGDRAPRRVGLPPGTHPRLIRAGRQVGRRLHGARPRAHQGRRPGLPARAGDRRHHRRRRPPGVRRPQGDQGTGRHAGHRLVHRRLHPGRAEDPARQGAAAGHPAGEHDVRRSVRGPDLHRAARATQAPVPGTRPRARRLPRDQAPDLLPEGRSAPRAATPGPPEPVRP